MGLDQAAMNASVVMAVTNLVARRVPPSWRNELLPWVALVAGVVVVVGQDVSAGRPITLAAVLMGIVVGGTSTGLYSVGKEVLGTKS